MSLGLLRDLQMVQSGYGGEALKVKLSATFKTCTGSGWNVMVWGGLGDIEHELVRFCHAH